MAVYVFQGNAGINGRSGLPGRKGEQVCQILAGKTVIVWCVVTGHYQVSSMFSRGTLDLLGPLGFLEKRDLLGPRFVLFTFIYTPQKIKGIFFNQRVASSQLKFWDIDQVS